ncbi:MFS transporter [Maribellus sp. YY47]|uniref:MFS transporter n=1 Tax=Maribellus sp. YY47 TaxID=2929486 RepID=UPI0020008990|nr:MFS transporter [Maribellus sp. YY47]MCK3682708.1 MFS transporter [Maribellus sp. YY47]
MPLTAFIRSKQISNSIRTIFRSLQYRNFRLFFSGQSISLIGTWIQRIAMPWLVYDLTNSVVLLGVVGFAGQIPTFLMAPFAGVIVDRKNRYKILVATQVLAMIQALMLATLVYTGQIQVWHLIALSIMLGLINAFDMPSRQSFMIEMVEKKDDLGNAIALNSTMVNGARLLGPSIAGVLISLAGEGTCFLINGLSYTVVITTLLLMKTKVKPKIKKTTKAAHEFQEGFRYTFGFKPVRFLILLLALVSLMGMPYSVLMPVYAKEILHGGSHTFGFLMGASGLGALSGALYLASRKNAAGLEKLIPVSAAAFGVGLILLALTNTFWVACIVMTITGIGLMMVMASSNTVIQTIIDDNKRGRVMSIYSMAFMGTAPFGSLMAGSLAKAVGTPMTLVFGGLCCIIGALIYLRKSPELQKHIQPVYKTLGILKEKEPKGLKD